MWMKFRHKFADGPDDWEWEDIGNIPKREIHGQVQSIRIEHEEKYQNFDHYRGIDYEVVELPPLEILVIHLKEALTKAENWKNRALYLQKVMETVTR